MPSSTSSDRRRHRCLAAAVAASAFSMLSGCALLPAIQRPPVTAAPTPAEVPTAPPPTAATPGPTTPSLTPTATTHSSPGSPKDPSTPTPTADADLATSFARFAGSQPGRLGIAVAAVGESTTPLTFGQPGSPVAWSTSKVPIAIAVERTEQANALRTAMRQAITASSNEAAERLWQSLGAPSEAAAATDRVLRDYGDATTQMQSERVRPPYTAFGQTRWSLPDQTRFAAALPCNSEAAPVYAAMGQIVADQRWGLGTLPGAHFKGGWGPSTTGSGHLVRQFGVIETPGGQVAVALAVEAPSFQQGTATLTQTSDWLRTHAHDLPAGRC